MKFELVYLPEKFFVARGVRHEIVGKVYPVSHLCNPLIYDREVVQQLRNESMKWVDIARVLGISAKTLIRRRKEFEMPIGADAFTRIEDRDLDQHIREIFRLNPEAGTAGYINPPINQKFFASHNPELCEDCESFASWGL